MSIKVILILNSGEAEKNASYKQKEFAFNVHKGFKAKYEEELKKAQEVEREEDAKRKQLIEALQERIKTIQTKYEEAGKNKIEKYREN